MMKCVDMYFERIEDDIQFDGVLPANKMIYFACVGEGDEDEDRNNE